MQQREGSQMHIAPSPMPWKSNISLATSKQEYFFLVEEQRFFASAPLNPLFQNIAHSVI